MKAVFSSVKRSGRVAGRHLIAVAVVAVLIAIAGVRHIAGHPDQAQSIAALAAADVAGAVNTSSSEPGPVDQASRSDTLHISQMDSTATDEAAGQKAILYEEEPTPPGARFEGKVSWRVGSVAATPRQPGGLALLADVEIPERGIRMTLSIQKNADASLPASHVGELAFALPVDFFGGKLLSVKGILMKASEQAKGAPLAAAIARVRDNLFLIRMSNVESERSRNVRLLKEAAWLDIPVVYENQRRVIFALEKGETGRHAFDEAFATWGQ
jgi:hypothetical protein